MGLMKMAAEVKWQREDEEEVASQTVMATIMSYLMTSQIIGVWNIPYFKSPVISIKENNMTTEEVIYLYIF